MTDHVSASVVGRFPTPAGAGGALSISPDPGIYNDSDVHLLLHPVRAQAFPSIGDLLVGDPKTIEVPSGVVQFGGGRTASLPLTAVASAPEFRVLIAFNTTGQRTSIGLSFDAATGVLTASRECHAAVAYTGYTSLSKRLRYRPVARTIPGGGIIAEFGAIAGVLRSQAEDQPPAIIVYQVQPFNIINGVAMYELYRIVSHTVTNGDAQGEHEKPPNYPTDGNYPSLDPIEIRPSLQTERVHEVGYMDESGRGWVNSYFVSALHPYVGDNAYVIPKTCRVANVTGFPRHLQQKALDFIASRNLGCRE